MKFFGPGGNAIPGERVVPVPSAARTANGSGSALSMGHSHTLRLTLDVTAASGTSPTLDVAVQHSADGTTWVQHSTFAQATAVSSQRKVVSGLDRYVQCSWTLGGTTPSFTFSVSGEQV
jgi:hypothetical protein